MNKKFNEKIAHWNTITDQGTATTYYWQEIFPEILQRAKKRSAKFQKKYQSLISLVGFSPEPIVLTVKILEPEFVLFLYTRDSQSKLDIIVEKAGLKLANIRYLPVSGFESEDVYSAIKGFISESHDKNIAVDITGGKKIMVYSAAIAGAIMGCDLVYIDFDEYDVEKRRPKPGTEYLNFLSNPFEVFGDLELEKGKRLFNEGNYYAASQIFLDLLKKLPRNDEAVYLHELSLMFKDWDEYNFSPALEACKKAIKQAQRCKIYLQLLDSLEEKEKILQRLLEGEPLTVILNHYFTSKRMAERNRFDFAALLLYRTLEMAFAIQLKNKYGFDVNKPDYPVLGKEEEIYEKYDQARKTIHGKAYKKESFPTLLSFMHAYQLLFALKDPMVQGQNPNWVKGIAQLRNQSIFAHGTSCIFEKDFQKFHQCFLPFLDYFIAEYFEGRQLMEFEDKFCFFRL